MSKRDKSRPDPDEIPDLPALPPAFLAAIVETAREIEADPAKLAALAARFGNKPIL